MWTKIKKNKIETHLHIVVIMCLFLMSSLAMTAQNRTIAGRVIDVAGEPVAGATVVVKGSAIGTATDADGNFSFAAPADALLEVSFIGYRRLEVNLSNQKDLTSVVITLHEDTEVLEEVVVIGYGSVKKSNLTGAVAKLDAKGIENRPLARAETALQGQLAGVTVRTITGEPGQDMQIRVRGAASINASSDPLYVIDGAPASTLSGINPSDIESIEVLKDASSAAIYGSRGNNGVVIVTTRRGQSGKPQVSVNTTYGMQSLEKKMDVMSAEEWINFNIKAIDARYISAAKAKGVNAGIGDDTNTRLQNLGLSTTAWGTSHYTYVPDPRWFKYADPSIVSGHNIQVNGINASDELSLLDWQDEYYSPAPVYQVDASISGGAENTRYLFSVGVFDQQGLATGTAYDRYTFRTNIESKLGKYLTAGLQLAPAYMRRDGSGWADGKDTRAHHVLQAAPVSGTGVGYATNVEPNVQYLWSGSLASPIAYMSQNIRHDDILLFSGNAFLRFLPVDGLKIELSGAATYNDLDGQTYIFSSSGSTWTQGEGANSSGGHNTSRSWTTLMQGLVNYDRTFGLHTIGVMLGASSEQSNIGFTTNQTYNKPFPNDAINYSFDEATLTVGNSDVVQLTPNRLASYFGRAMYNFDERYLLSASIRRDGGSVFGLNNKWGWFPAASIGWVISNEQFFKSMNLDWWNMLKLRASYGVTGNNQISNTAAYATLTAVTYAGAAGYSAGSLGNTDLGWEKSHSTDVAIDLGFAKNRIQLSFDWYTKNTTNLLYQVPAIGASGFTTVWDNLGEIHNEGYEVELNTVNVANRDFHWTTAFNLSYNRNEVISIGADNTPVYAGFDGSNASNILTVGQPVNSFYLYDAIGVWKTQKELDDYAAETGVQAVTFEGKTLVPGDLRYDDVNHDGAFDKANDRKILGSPIPKFTYGLTNRLSYRDFDMSILLTAQTGGKVFGVLGRANDRPSMNPNSNMMDVWLNAWWSETEQGDGHTPYILSATTGGTVDSRWLWSSDYLRIKNLTIGYKLPLPAKYVQNARIYLSAENLLKWDNYYNGYSPEAANTQVSGAPGGAGALGIDYGGYPIARIFTIGLNLNF